MPSRILAVLIVALVSALGAAPVGAQEYTVPTTPEYQTPDSGAGPDQGAGETPDDEAAAPDDDAEAPSGSAPSSGAGEQAPQAPSSGTLPVTGSEHLPFFITLGLVLLLGGFTIRRGLGLAGPA